MTIDDWKKILIDANKRHYDDPFDSLAAAIYEAHNKRMIEARIETLQIARNAVEVGLSKEIEIWQQKSRTGKAGEETR